MNNYVERLSTEWNTHGKIVIAVDFDDTLHPWKFASVNPNVVRIIKDAKRIGAYIVIWTACDEARYPEIRHVCSSLGLEIDAINDVPLDLPYGKGRKIYYNILIDDRAGLENALDILQKAMNNQLIYLNLNKPASADVG